ncbi:MAG: glycosyltransferase [bacterium]
MNKTFNPKVSIIIPVYNGEDYVREAIDSALAQTYKNIEIIVINDGSKDNTEKIVKEYGDNVRYFYKDNGGVASALNTGIEKMEGEYFSWLSHDDVYYPNKISKQINSIRENQEIFIVYSNVEYIDENSKFINKTIHERYHSLSKLNMGLYPVIKGVANGCSMLINKKCFDKVGLFNEKLLTANDYDMWFRMFRSNKIKFMPEVLIKYRLHKKQGTSTIKTYNNESDELWSVVINSLSIDEILGIESSVYLFFAKFAEQMKAAGFEKAYNLSLGYAEQNNPQNKVKLSVVMPSYNSKKYIAKSIASILEQTFTNYELIIVDDGSIDNTWKIINKYKKKDRRIIAVRNEKNEGISKAMNKGIALAKGEYITRMDSDDISLPERLDRQIFFLDKNKEYGLCSTNISSFNKKNATISASLYAEHKTPIEWLFLWMNPIANAPAMYRSEIIRENLIKYNEKLKTAEDYDFICHIIRHTRVYQINKVLYMYRIHPDGMFRKNIKETCVNSINVSENFAEWLTEKRCPSFHKYLTVFPFFLEKEIVISDSSVAQSWLDNLFFTAKSKWNWEERECKEVMLDIKKRISNYSIGIYDESVNGIFGKKDDENSLTKWRVFIRKLIEVVKKIPVVGPVLIMILKRIKTMMFDILDLKFIIRLFYFNFRNKICHRKKKKILFVAMPNSIHTARWISQFEKEKNIEIHLFPSTYGETHPMLKKNSNLIIYNYNKDIFSDLKIASSKLEKVINYLKPNIIHSLEMQHSAYLVLQTKQQMQEKKFPFWFYSCWGSDIKWFEQYPDHKKRIANVLHECDVFFCEDKYTIEKVKYEYNFNREIFVVNATGGYKTKYFWNKFKFILPSERPYVLLKGYSGWVYRPEVIFSAAKMCVSEILKKNLKIMVYLPGNVNHYINDLRSLGVTVEIFNHTQDYDAMMELFSKARLNIASSLSDGAPTSMIEGMLMGAFPIQSFSDFSSCSKEYIDSGKNGFLIDPQDISGYAKAIKVAIENDDLVNNAASYNQKFIEEKLEYNLIKEKVLKIYTRFLSS